MFTKPANGLHDDFGKYWLMPVQHDRKACQFMRWTQLVTISG